MKDAEEEAFDDLAKRQGDWGSGFQAKRAAAMDKINADFDEEYIKYRDAFPKGYTVPQSAQEPPSEWASIKAVLDEYGLQAIDFVADFKAALAQPAQESWREFASDYERGFIDGMQKQAQSSVDKAVNRMAQPAQEPDMQTGIAYQKGFHDGKQAALAQPAQEPVAWRRLDKYKVAWRRPIYEYEDGITSFRYDPSGEPLYAYPPQRPWVGLTDEEVHEICNSYYYGDKELVKLIETKLKEKNA